MKRILFLLVLLLPMLLQAQRQRRRANEKPANVGKAFLVHLGYGFHDTGADLKERFGAANSLMLGTELIFANNYFLGAQTHLFFGQNVKEDPVSNLRITSGDIIGNNRGLAMFVLRQRGLHVGGYMGRLFSLGSARSGIRVSAGAGYTQHKIRLQDDGQSIVQIDGDYEKGYDRLTAGLGLTQFIGYQRIPLQRGFSFIFGLELEQGLTRSYRDWDFNTMMKDDRNRFDLRYGLRFGLTLPFYGFSQAEEIIY